MKAAEPSNDETCPSCGGELNHPVALAIRKIKDAAAAKEAARIRQEAQRPKGWRQTLSIVCFSIAGVSVFNMIAKPSPMFIALWYFDKVGFVLGLAGFYWASRRRAPRNGGSTTGPPPST
jgi:hypothetical protein